MRHEWATLARRDLVPPPHRRLQRTDRGLTLCVKKVKRAGRGFTRFDHYRLVRHDERAVRIREEDSDKMPRYERTLWVGKRLLTL